MKIVSLSFFRNAASNYEIPACGVNQGLYFGNYLHSVIHAFWAVFGNDYWLEIAHDTRVIEKREFRFLEELERRSLIRLRNCGEAKTLCGAMLWRMDPLFRDDVDLVVCRDIDSLFMPRDRKMIEAFEASRGIIHGINDSESHSIPLLGGMCAFKGDPFRKHFTKSHWEDLKAMHDLSEHGSDQRFLNAIVYNTMKAGLITHTRKPMINYECLRSYPALPQEEELDKVVRHIGAGFDTEAAMAVLGRMAYPNKAMIEECWNGTL